LGFPHRDTRWPLKSLTVARIWASRKTRPKGCPMRESYVGQFGREWDPGWSGACEVVSVVSRAHRVPWLAPPADEE